MTLLWEASYSVGVREIDEQHRLFILIMNDLYSHFQNIRPRAELSEILERLVKYAEFHFATEEKYFDEFGYEDAEEHKRQHRAFEDRLLRFQKNFSEGEEDIAMPLLDFLENWLVSHINTQDKKYTECFREHGLL